MKAGIWLDSHTAFIVYISNGTVQTTRVESEVEDYHVHGGAAAPSPYGTHDAVSESRILERKKQQLNRYFKDLKDRIKDCEAIYLCGPAETKVAFGKEIVRDKNLKEKLLQVQSSSLMTENQIIAKIKAFFRE